jgi:hypothetical protein
MVCRVRKQLVEEGFEAVLSRKQRATPAVVRIFDGEKEAKLIALACSKPPKGRARWTLRLFENKVVELHIVDRASDSTIGRTLKKNTLKPHRRQQWVIPPKANGAFVALWKTCWPSTRGHAILIVRWFAWTRPQSRAHQRQSLHGVWRERDGDHSLEFHQPTFVHCHDFLDTSSRFISIIATIKVRYRAAILNGAIRYRAAILNGARRLECPKHLSLTSPSAP